MGLAPIFGKFGLKEVDPAVALSIRSFFISAIMLGWLILNKDISPVTNISISGWVFIAFEGICAALLGQLFYYYALKSGDASMVVPLIASFPLFTFIIASIFLGDKVTLTKIAGLAMIILGVVVIRL